MSGKPSSHVRMAACMVIAKTHTRAQACAHQRCSLTALTAHLRSLGVAPLPVGRQRKQE